VRSRQYQQDYGCNRDCLNPGQQYKVINVGIADRIKHHVFQVAPQIAVAPMEQRQENSKPRDRYHDYTQQHSLSAQSAFWKG
jgi:hypothetical protein